MDLTGSDEKRESKVGIPDRHLSKRVPGATGKREKPEPRTGKLEVKLIQNPDHPEGSGDVEDHHEKLKADCRETEECSKMFALLEECNERVNSREKTKETCEQELYDLVECVDACVAKDLFKFLK